MNIAKMLQQAQKMQKDMQAVQEELARRTVEAGAGGGKVLVKATAAGEVVSIKIDPSVVDPGSVDLLEDLVLTAIRQAAAKGREIAAAEMGKVTGGMNLPALGM